MRWRVLFLVMALAAAFVPIPPSVIESIYSERLFPFLQIILTSISNHVGFALFDVLVIAAVVLWLVFTTADLLVARRAGWVRATARIAMRTLTIAAAAYLVFLVAWGLNYRRVRLEDKVQFDRSRISADAATALAAEAVSRVNALYEPAHQMGWFPPAMSSIVRWRTRSRWHVTSWDRQPPRCRGCRSALSSTLTFAAPAFQA